MKASGNTPDALVLQSQWSDLSQFKALPEIDFDRLHRYRMSRIRQQLKIIDAAFCILISPVSLRYAVDYRTYGLFQAHIPTTYLFVPQEGPVVLHAAYGTAPGVDRVEKGRALAVFDGGNELSEHARLLAQDAHAYLSELGSDNRRVAVEYINPSLTQALQREGFDVVDGVRVSEMARVIKSDDEIACMQWAIDVAQYGIAKVQDCLKPGVRENELWALLNYTNLANDGDWHDGRMLASGPRINPWLQEASNRAVEPGDLVGFDTDMVGPYGYCADISRTLHCGPVAPSARQKQLYQYAQDEITHNSKLMKPGMRFKEIQESAWPIPEEFQQNAYTCIVHAVGMCDEYPRINPIHRGETPYDGVLEVGMVMCVESYIGAVGERDGVKLEQQVLIDDSEQGHRVLSDYPLDERLL